MSFVYATLRIYSETIGPDEISRTLSAEPTKSWNKGDPLPAGSRVHPQNGWLLDSTIGVDADVEEHIRELATFVASREEALERLVSSGEVRADILCSFGDDTNYHYGLSLEHEVMGSLAKAHISLGLDCIYPRENVDKRTAGKPRAMLDPLPPDPRSLRVPGKGRGRFRVKPDFDAPLPDREIDRFEA
jgi:hypothetical protein